MRFDLTIKKFLRQPVTNDKESPPKVIRPIRVIRPHYPSIDSIERMNQLSRINAGHTCRHEPSHSAIQGAQLTEFKAPRTDAISSVCSLVRSFPAVSPLIAGRQS